MRQSGGLQRERMGDLLTQLEKDIPNVREVMLAALKNVRPTHLLDTTVSSTRNQELGSEQVLEECGTESPVELASHYNYGLKPGPA